MNSRITPFVMCFLTLIVYRVQAQESTSSNFPKDIPVISFQQPDLTKTIVEDVERDRNGQMYRIGIATEVNLTTDNSGIWSMQPNGDRVWRLKIKYPGAQALSFIFSKFHLFGNSKINVFGEKGNKLHLTYTAKDVLDHGQQNLSLCVGDYMMLELVEPVGTPASILEMETIYYIYRSVLKSQEKDFGGSESCEVNVNCSPEGSAWQDEKRGVARILVSVPGATGWCSGSLINNARQDCKPYFLTAMHCGEGATASNFNNWRFYFNYEASGCSNPSSEGTLATGYFTGCVKVAASEDVNNGTISHSDFLLVHIGSMASESSTITSLKAKNVYWNGWDVNNAASPSGVSIHHPAGDIKKISTYTTPTISTTYSGINPNTHWQVYWSSTSNGYGVTEPGSSGSPLFTYNGGNSRIVGDLSGGLSYCNATSQPDLYGKLAYSWTTVGTADALRLKPWLDPDASGVLVFDGSYDPCNSTPPTTGPCAATSSACDEYIAQVQLNTINNSTGCTNYTDYSSISTPLNAGVSYTVSVVPGVVGSGVGYGYTDGDIIGVWIDFNNNGTLTDANEFIGSEAFSTTYTGQFNFTVPMSVPSATVRMRVRIDYSPSTFSPCGTSSYGEVEDYRLVLINPANPLGINENSMEDVVIAPNPVVDQLIIQLNSQSENMNVSILDMTGKEVLQLNTNNQSLVELNVAHLSSGVYQVIINTEKGRIVKRILKK